MSATETKALIGTAVERITSEVPALANLTLVMRLNLEARGGDAPIWRVEVPGPKVDRDPAGDARIDVTVQRQHFNRLAEEGTLREWAKAYEQGYVKASGDPGIVKLLGNVMGKQLQRTRA
mgnify:CR=1 FL=1